MCANVKCVTVGDDKQSIHAGFPKHLTVTGWTGLMIVWERLLTKNLRCEPYSKHCGRVTRPSGKKSNRSIAGAFSMRSMTPLLKVWHTPFTTLTTSQLPEKCARSKWSTAYRISRDRREELKLWGSNLPEETPQAFTHSTLMWKVSL